MPISPFDIARSHVRLPVNRDYSALKQVLRDWLKYTEQTDLHAKSAFPAALAIEVRRPTPESLHHRGKSASPASPLSGRLSAWRQRGRVDAAFHRHTSRTPLSLYTALLPWEVQRGLSKAALTLPEVATPPAATVADAETAASGVEEDPFGVVTATAPTAGSGKETVAAVATTAAAAGAPVMPGMLFVLDLKGVRESNGQIGFWSGAITRPIDVLFFAPTEAATVSQSASFQRIRQRDVQMQVEDNEIAPDVVARYFPRNELRSSDRYKLRLHTYGHLDPFPWCEEANSSGASDANLGDRRFSVEAPLTPENKQDEATLPRIVLETIRHTVRQQVQQAMSESLADYRHVYGDDALSLLTAVTDGEAEDVELDITLELSDALRADVMDKAQLCTHYVGMLEDAVHRYATALNRPIGSDAGAEPATEHEFTGNGGAAGGKGEQQRMQVWLSETEQVWMTPSELAAFQQEQSRRHAQTPREASLQEEEEEARRSGEDQDQNDDDDYMSMRAADEDDMTITADVPQEDSLSDSGAQTVSHSAPSFVTPAREGAVRADKSIGRQSPMLAEEDEGRPSYLSPGFTGRHEAPTLAQLATVSADKLARYPRTRSEMPVLPPVDYELLDLCLRLGVGQSSVLYHYYERILREWRQELKALRAGSRDGVHSKNLDDADVARMSALVRDASLQVPEELRSLVNAVAAAREKQAFQRQSSPAH